MPDTTLITSNVSIDAGILAGGRGQRMGGLDKGLVTLDGKPMIQHVFDALSPCVSRVWINCNRNEDLYLAISPFVCKDTSQDFAGPLAGMASILYASSADFIITSPCDTPFIGTDYADRMRAALAKCLSSTNMNEQPLVLAARTGDKVHPLHLCLSRHALPGLTSRLENSELKVFAWLNSLDPAFVDFSDNEIPFRNINHLDDLTR